MGEMDDDRGLGLSLSLGCGAQRHHYRHQRRQRQRQPQQPQPSNLKSNLIMPFPLQFMQNNDRQVRSSLGDIFPSSSSADRNNADTRSFPRLPDMNSFPLAGDIGEDETGVSSPNSTVSSISTGKRSDREPIGDETEAEREYSCSRGSDDEDDGVGGDASKKKLRLSKEQALVLEETFREHNTLNPKQKLALAKQLNLRPRQVEVWFQNRRARTKLKQTEVDCEYLKRCCENLTQENRRLQKEVQELRALKLSPQLYMQMSPPTTLTMCPSCERVSVSSSSSAVAPTGQSWHPTAPNPQRPLPLVNPWAAMPIPHRPFNPPPPPPPSKS